MKLRRAATVFLLALSAVMGTSVAYADRAAYVDAVAEEKWLEALAAYDDLDADDKRDPLLRFGRAQALSAAGLDSAGDREAAAAEESRLRVFRTEPRAKSPLPLLGFVSANGASPPDIARSLEVLRDVARKEARTKGCRRFRGESVDDYRMHCLAFHYLDTRTHSEEAAILLEAAALKKPGTLAPWLIPAAKAWLRARKEEKAAIAYERVQSTGTRSDATEAAHALIKLQVTRAEWEAVRVLVPRLQAGPGLDADDLLRLKAIAAAVSDDGLSLAAFRSFRALHEPRPRSLFAGRLALLEALGLRRRGRIDEAKEIWERLAAEARPIVAHIARDHLGRAEEEKPATCRTPARLVERVMKALPPEESLSSGPWLHRLAGAGLLRELRQELRSIGLLDAGPRFPLTREGWAELQVLTVRFDKGLATAPGDGVALHGPAFWPALIRLEKSLGIPRGLLTSLMRQESGYKSDVRSPAGAIGLLQLMPGTAIRYGIGESEGEVARNLRDPMVNLHAGAAHIAMLLGRTRGEISLAVGAYNAGLDPVERWRAMLRGGPPELVLEAAAFGETRLYMWSVLDDWIDVRRCLGLPIEDPI